MLYFAGGYPGSIVPPVEVVFIPPPVALPTELVVEIPMRIVTGGTTRRATVIAKGLYPLAMMRQTTVPMTRGMSERVEIPARVAPLVVLERE